MERPKVFRIVTPRLVIRCYELTDASLLKTSVDESLEHLKPWMPWAKHEPEPLKEKMKKVQAFRDQFIAGEDFLFAVLNTSETEILGSTGLHPRIAGNAREIGYWVNARYTRQGIATEIVRSLTKVGFEIEGLDRIEIRCDVKNEVSAMVPKKCGYVLKGILSAHMKDVSGNDRDTMVWEMLKEEYFKNPFSIALKVSDFYGSAVAF